MNPMTSCGGTRTIASLVVLGLALAGCTSERDANIKDVHMAPGETRIRLLVDTCNARHKSHVVESSTEVRVTVRARNEENGDCADAVEITLTAPLGTRPLIDESDDEVVPVTIIENLRYAS